MNTIENKAKDIIEDLVTDLAEQNIHIGGSTIINLYMDIVELTNENATAIQYEAEQKIAALTLREVS